MLFSSTGVDPTVTVPLTLPLTRCGAPGRGGAAQGLLYTLLDKTNRATLHASLGVHGATLTVRETVASVSIEARPAVTTEACGVVGAKCILGALLLESKSKEMQLTHSGGTAKK